MLALYTRISFDQLHTPQNYNYILNKIDNNNDLIMIG